MNTLGSPLPCHAPIHLLDQSSNAKSTLHFVWNSKLHPLRQGSAFLSQELKEFLTRRGAATSKTTPYYLSGNGQCERYNGIIWKSVLLALKSQPHSVGTCASHCPPLNFQHQPTPRHTRGSSVSTIWRISPIVAHCPRKSDATPLCSTQ